MTTPTFNPHSYSLDGSFDVEDRWDLDQWLSTVPRLSRWKEPAAPYFDSVEELICGRCFRPLGSEPCVWEFGALSS